MEESKLVYDQEEGTILFVKDNKKSILLWKAIGENKCDLGCVRAETDKTMDPTPTSLKEFLLRSWTYGTLTDYTLMPSQTISIDGSHKISKRRSGDENPIRTLGDYSKPSHEGYRNTIELPTGNNVVPLRSDTIRERTGLRLFQFSLRDQASNWLERLPTGSISTWEDLTTRFLAQFFPPGRTAKLSNDILMFQQHHGESLSEAWTRFKDLLQKVPHHGIDLWLQAITLPQDVPSTSDHRLIELENQVQCLMEAHLALTQPTQVNKITTSCKICSDPHDTQYCMEDLEQAFVEYASSRTDEAGGTHPISSARSCPFIDPQCSFHLSTSINAIKAHFNDAIIEPQQPEEPKPNLEDEFKDLHLNLPVLEVLAHVPIYNAILDKYVESLELGKNGSTFVQGETPVNIGDPGLFTLPCRLGDSKPFDTLDDLGSCVNIIPLYLFKKLNIRLLEETDHIFGLADGTKSYPARIVKDVEVHIEKLKLLNDFYILDMKKDPETPLLVGRGFLATANVVIDCRIAKITVGKGITRDGAWHAKIRLINPDGEEFTKTLQSIPTARKLSERESPREIIDLEPLYDTDKMTSSLATRLENFIKNKNFIFTDCGDGVMINKRSRHHDTCDGVTTTLTASNAQVIFDEEKLGSY
ncbi:MAK10-like protein [Tanacetum coccineum]